MLNKSFKISDQFLLVICGLSLILCLFLGYLTIEEQQKLLSGASSNFIVFPLTLALLVLTLGAALCLCLLMYSPLPFFLGMIAAFALAFWNRRGIADELISLIPWQTYAYGVLCALMLVLSFVAAAFYKSRKIDRENDELMSKAIEKLEELKAKDALEVQQ